MNTSTDNEILSLVAQVMTSGIKQEGARFTLPESMIIELVQRAMAMEREACASVLETDGDAEGNGPISTALRVRAAIIRSRGK